MRQTVNHRVFLAIALTTVLSMVNRVLRKKRKLTISTGMDWQKNVSVFFLTTAEPLISLELSLTMEYLAHPQKWSLECYLCRLPWPFAVEQRYRIASARLSAIGAIAFAQWFTTPESMMVASQCPDGSIQHRLCAHAGSRSDRIAYRFFRQDGIPAPLILCFARFLENWQRTKIACRHSSCRGHYPSRKRISSLEYDIGGSATWLPSFELPVVPGTKRHCPCRIARPCGFGRSWNGWRIALCFPRRRLRRVPSSMLTKEATTGSAYSLDKVRPSPIKRWEDCRSWMASPNTFRRLFRLNLN